MPEPVVSYSGSCPSAMTMHLHAIGYRVSVHFLGIDPIAPWFCNNDSIEQ